MERDAEYATRKAERACLRTCLREKYRLPKVRVPGADKQISFSNLVIPVPDWLCLSSAWIAWDCRDGQAIKCVKAAVQIVAGD